MHLSFTRLKRHDLSLLHSWLTLEFIARWYDKRKFVYDDIEASLAGHRDEKVPVEGYLVHEEDMPIGYIHIFPIASYPRYVQCVALSHTTWCLDFFIGAKEFMYKGIGKDIVRQFVKQHVFTNPAVSACIVGPSPSDTALIRVYEKAGFTYLTTVQCEGHADPEYLMILKRSNYTMIYEAKNSGN